MDFLLIALSLFVFVTFINKAKERMEKKEEEAAPAPEEPKCPTQEELLAEIRDLLKNK